MDVITYTIEQEAEVLSREESHFFDFKRSQIQPKDLEKHVVAFANADGGEIFIGLDDDKSLAQTDRVWGFANAEAANAHLASVYNNINPSLSRMDFEFIRFPAKPTELVLHIILSKSDKIHYTSSKDCYQRKGAQSLLLKGEAIQQLIFAKGQSSYEDVAVDNVRLTDLRQSDYLKKYLRLVPTSQPVDLFLQKNKLMLDETETTKGPRALTAAVLLFDDNPSISLPTKCGVKVIRMKTTEMQYDRRHLSGAPVTLEGPVAELIYSAVAQVSNIMNTATFRRGKKYVSLQYPPEAVHEIIANAVLHRDYSVKDDIHITVYDNRIEVSSPGRLPGNVTVEHILKQRFMRNPKIFRYVAKLPDAPNKDMGEGLDTAFRVMEEARLKPPLIEELPSAVRVTLFHERIASPDVIIVRYLKNNATIKNSDGRRITGMQRDNSVSKVFRRLKDTGVIEPIDNQASPFQMEYRLCADWRAKFGSADEVDRE